MFFIDSFAYFSPTNSEFYAIMQEGISSKNDKIRALNMSNVCAICVYEALRQQDYNDLFKEEPDCFKGSDWLLTDDE